MRIPIWCCSISGSILVLFVTHGSTGWFSWKIRGHMVLYKWCHFSLTYPSRLQAPEVCAFGLSSALVQQSILSSTVSTSCIFCHSHFTRFWGLYFTLCSCFDMGKTEMQDPQKANEKENWIKYKTSAQW